MGACFYRLRCEVFQNLFLSPMNTGFVRPAVATVLTACGIETIRRSISLSARKGMLQQYLPLAVLKHVRIDIILLVNIELLQQYLPLAVLKRHFHRSTRIALLKLQQYLPLAVLKH